MTNDPVRPRPLSPHLSIYRPHITMVMSIMHRITGVGLYLGSILLVIWLVTIATSSKNFEIFVGLFSNWFGQLILFGFIWSLSHHTLGGLKHLVQDTGAWLSKERVNLLGILHPILSLLGAIGVICLICS